MNIERITVIVWVVFLGICCAAFYAYYQRRILGDIVRALIANEAHDEQSAKTLDEIGYTSSIRRISAAFSLRDGTTLRKTVKAADSVDQSENKPRRRHKDELAVPSFLTENGRKRKYFIPNDACQTAELRYDAKGTSASTLLLTVAAFFAAAIVVISLLPQIERAINSISSGFSSNNKSVITDTADTSDALHNSENSDVSIDFANSEATDA